MVKSDAKFESLHDSVGLSLSTGANCGCKKVSKLTSKLPCENHAFDCITFTVTTMVDVEKDGDRSEVVTCKEEGRVDAMTTCSLAGFITGLYAGFGTAVRVPRGKNCVEKVLSLDCTVCCACGEQIGAIIVGVL